jgi:hypothetical protein
MLQSIFFCCQSNDKEQPDTITLEERNNNNTKNTNNINQTTQDNTIQKNVEETYNNNNIENKQFYPTGVLLGDKGIFMNDNSYNNTNPSPIFTINNINNININFQRNSFSKEPTKLIGKKDSNISETPKNNINDINDIIRQKTELSDEQSRDKMQNNSLSFSNLTIKYNNNNQQGSSMNFSDTEILSSCEIILMGELFFNKEIRLVRSGIKNLNASNTNRIYKNKPRKACEIKLGVSYCNGKQSSSSLIKNYEEKNNNHNDKSTNSNIKVNKKTSAPNVSHFSSKNVKLASLKNNQKKKLQSISSMTSLNNIINKNVDIILNLSYNKISKKINENSNNINNNEDIVLFILKYDTTLDLFQLISTEDSAPVELLINYNYPLRFQQNYNIIIGGITIQLKVDKNEKNISILNVIVLNSEKNGQNKDGEDNPDILYKFNPFVDKMPITIGRINCDINLNNIAVSKLNAQIDYIYDYDEFFITDCKSTNGTYLMLKYPLNSITIKRDLQLKLFDSKFKIHYLDYEIN